MKIIIAALLFFSVQTSAITITFANCTTNNVKTLKCTGPWLRTSGTKKLLSKQSSNYETTADPGSKWDCYKDIWPISRLVDSKTFIEQKLLPANGFTLMIDDEGTKIIDGANQPCPETKKL